MHVSVLHSSCFVQQLAPVVKTFKGKADLTTIVSHFKQRQTRVVVKSDNGLLLYFFVIFSYNLCCSFSLLDLKSLASSKTKLKGSNSNTVFAVFAVIRGILEPGATVKILSLVLGFGVFSLVMVIAVAVHLLYYEEQKSNVRAVLHRHKKSASINYRLV